MLDFSSSFTKKYNDNIHTAQNAVNFYNFYNHELSMSEQEQTHNNKEQKPKANDKKRQNTQHNRVHQIEVEPANQRISEQHALKNTTEKFFNGTSRRAFNNVLSRRNASQDHKFKMVRM
jgi:hypothetical protein